jgi:hypothetical protein
MTEDRLKPSYFEPDEEGYLMAHDEADENGFAKGATLALYVLYPWEQNGAYPETEAGLPKLNRAGFTEWLEARYPTLDFDFSADVHATAEIGDEYRDGETTEELLGRLHDTPDWIRLRNEGTIFYTMRDAWAKHCGVELYPEVAR